MLPAAGSSPYSLHGKLDSEIPGFLLDATNPRPVICVVLIFEWQLAGD